MKLIVKNNVVFATHSDGQAVEALYPDTVALTIPDAFKKADGTGVLPGDNLAECLDLVTAKAMMRDHIEAGMTEARNAGFSCSNGIKIQCAEIDMIRWMQAKALVDLAGLTAIDIRDYGNVIHGVQAAAFNGMLLEVGGYIQGLLANAWMLKDTVDGSESIDEVLATHWV